MKSQNEITIEKRNEIVVAILDMVEAVESLQEEKILSALNAVLTFENNAVMREVFLCIQDEMVGKTPVEILAGITLPLPPNPADLLFAFGNNDLVSVQQIIGSEKHHEILFVLLVLLATLRNSRKATR